MRLNKIEKIIVVVIIVGLVIGLGVFLFVVPAIDKINDAQARVDSLNREKDELNEKLARLDTIDADIDKERKQAQTLEGSFYPDLTTYEASEIAMQYLKEANLEAHQIDVASITTTNLELEAYKADEIKYDLKTYSKTAAGNTDTVTSGTFTDGGKEYTVVVNEITDVKVMDGDNVVDPKNYTRTMKNAHDAALCAYAESSKAKQTVGAVIVRYDVTGNYIDYLNFLDYINSLDRATMIDGVVIPMSGPVDVITTERGPDGSEIEHSTSVDMVYDEEVTVVDASINLVFFCVEPMNSLDSLTIGDRTIDLTQ